MVESRYRQQKKELSCRRKPASIFALNTGLRELDSRLRGNDDDAPIF